MLKAASSPPPRHPPCRAWWFHCPRPRHIGRLRSQSIIYYSLLPPSRTYDWRAIPRLQYAFNTQRRSTSLFHVQAPWQVAPPAKSSRSPARSVGCSTRLCPAGSPESFEGSGIRAWWLPGTTTKPPSPDTVWSCQATLICPVWSRPLSYVSCEQARQHQSGGNDETRTRSED